MYILISRYQLVRPDSMEGLFECKTDYHSKSVFSNSIVNINTSSLVGRYISDDDKAARIYN